MAGGIGLFKNSLLYQTKVLFAISIVFVLILWSFFYIELINHDKDNEQSRFFSLSGVLRNSMIHSFELDKNILQDLNIKIYDKNIPKNATLVFQRGGNKGHKAGHRGGFGLVAYKIENKNIICFFNPNGRQCFEDLEKPFNSIFLHTIFIALLFIQILIYLRLNKSLKPLSLIHKKLESIKSGDMSLLDVKSEYKEISQVVNSYNESISKIKYMLTTKEMFNKIFMHEIKTPIAKGMFYLKLKPSPQTHEKITQLFHTINKELDEFSVVETLISQQNKITPTPHEVIKVINEALLRLNIGSENIALHVSPNCQIFGDFELWVLCFKNLIDNALKYANDGKLTLTCKENMITFSNKGESLPVNITQDITNWKINKSKRHKSSTGYGFGLFIIKNITLINGYEIKYLHVNGENRFEIVKAKS